MNWHKTHKQASSPETRDLLEQLWGKEEMDRFFEMLMENNLHGCRFILDDSLTSPYYSPGAIHVSTAHIRAKWPVLHELGHYLRGQENPLYNLWLCKDFTGNPISFNEAVKRLLEEEKFANNFANEMLERYRLNIRPRHFEYPPEIVLSVLNDIRKKGLQTVEQVMDHVQNVATGGNYGRRDKPQSAPSRHESLIPKPQYNLRKEEKDLDSGWNNSIDQDD